ncbi:ATP-grasp domain-containing protein [Candidatus Margulisiibacteriota bacterium]
MKKKYNFLITPLNGRNAGTEAFKGLKLTNLYNKIVGTDISSFSYGNHVTKHFYIQPYASSNGYINAILDIVKKEQIDVIIPGSDYELKALSKNRDLFSRLDVHLLVNSSSVIDVCMDKAGTSKFLRDNNLPYIKTQHLSFNNGVASPSYAEVEALLGLPFVVKPQCFSGGSNGISIIQDQDDWQAFERTNANSHVEFIAQQYIDAPNNEYTVGVMSDVAGKIISSFALRRDLTTAGSIISRVKFKRKEASKNEHIIISSGISQGLVKEYRRVRGFAEIVAVKLKSVGPLNIQCRLYKGKIYIFEINPRFSGTTSIRAVLGHNDVELIFYSIIKGVNLGQQKYNYASVVRGKDVNCKVLEK